MNGACDAFGRNRLDDEIESPGAHCLHHRFNAALARLDYDRYVGAHLVKGGQKFQPAHFRHHQIEHDDIDAATVLFEDLQPEPPVLG